MARSAAITGDIVHSVAVRYRATGVGMLRTRLINMGTEPANIKTEDLDDLVLDRKTNREKTALANFQDQGVQIYFRTIHIDEVLNITKITCFVKSVAESWPIKSGG